jgi:hypothetical protein
MIPITMIDITGFHTVRDVIETLRMRDVVFVAAGRQTEWSQWAESRGLNVGWRWFPALKPVRKRYEMECGPPTSAVDEHDIA